MTKLSQDHLNKAILIEEFAWLPESLRLRIS
jgi:hypothetical protein